MLTSVRPKVVDEQTKTNIKKIMRYTSPELKNLFKKEFDLEEKDLYLPGQKPVDKKVIKPVKSKKAKSKKSNGSIKLGPVRRKKPNIQFRIPKKYVS
jgi:hypothetical protein